MSHSHRHSVFYTLWPMTSSQIMYQYQCWKKLHMGLKHASIEKKCTMVIFLIFVHKNVYRIRFQKIIIGPLKGFEKKAFFSLLLMRKRLSGGQKWFLKPYFPLIRGMFVFRSGLRFSFRFEEKWEKCLFLKTLSWPDFDLLESNSIYTFIPFICHRHHRHVCVKKNCPV